MEPNPAPRKPAKGLLIKVALLAVIVLAGGVAVLRGLDVRGLLDQAMDLVREAGPVVFFGGMAVLPSGRLVLARPEC